MKLQQAGGTSRQNGVPRRGSRAWSPAPLDRDFGRLEATVEGLRRDVDNIKEDSLRRQSEDRSDRRTWLLALLPTAAFVGDVLARVFL